MSGTLEMSHKKLKIPHSLPDFFPNFLVEHCDHYARSDSIFSVQLGHCLLQQLTGNRFNTAGGTDTKTNAALSCGKNTKAVSMGTFPVIEIAQMVDFSVDL